MVTFCSFTWSGPHLLPHQSSSQPLNSGRLEQNESLVNTLLNSRPENSVLQFSSAVSLLCEEDKGSTRQYRHHYIYPFTGTGFFSPHVEASERH